MTGYAQVRGEVQRALEAAAGGSASGSPSNQSDGRLAFALALKSVNHRFLDLHFRMPSGTDSLEMQLRRLLKEKMSRGHVEVTLSLERASSETFALNREFVGGYIAAFRAAAAEKLLEGASGTPLDIEKAAAVAADGIEPHSDLYASADYRRQLAKVSTARAIRTALSRIG